MTTADVTTDVLIVGAGPVGLFMANECARRGLGWRLIEERTRDQSYRLGTPPFATFITGDPEIDLVLMRYSRPAGLGSS